MGYSKTLGIGDSFEFGSVLTQMTGLTNVANDLAMGTITIPNVDGGFKHVFLSVYIGRIYNNAAGTNYVHLAQDIVVENGGGDVTAITIPTASMLVDLGSSMASGCVIVGNLDCKSAFVMGSPTNVWWRSAKALFNTLYFRDVQCVARVVLE